MSRHSQFVLYLGGGDFPVSLEPRKFYRRLRDLRAERHQMIRVIDESGEDYLYPASLFVTLPLTAAIRRALSATG